MNYKKYWPFVAVIVFAIVVVGGIFAFKKLTAPIDNGSTSVDESVPDLPQSQWPIVELIPSSDGHYVSLNVTGINVPTATSMDYILEYKANNGVGQTTQGVPGTIQLNGQTGVSRDSILLGSESSGHIRFDSGVETGQLTLRFRDGNGKLLGKVVSDWHLQTNTTDLSSVDGSFKYTLSKAATGVWFITIKPFGTPSSPNLVVNQNGYAIYSSDGKPHAGSSN
ncbi:MAG TPA: hypothetical protein VG895_02790 [Patescibacteria group bacterium]|nr:hypothetical protein [Patescibacteria group bacterium]